MPRACARNGWNIVAVCQNAAMGGALRDRKRHLSFVADGLSGQFDLVSRRASID
jgi:hypothetical protein